MILPPQNWDQYLIDKLKDKEGGLIVRDGYQLPDSSNMAFPADYNTNYDLGMLLKN